MLPHVVAPAQLLLFTSSERIMGEHASRPWFTGEMGLGRTFHATLDRACHAVQGL